MPKRSIKEPFILIVQALDFPLIKRNFIDEKNELSGLFTKKNRGASKSFFVLKNGNIQQDIQAPFWDKKLEKYFKPPKKSDFVQIITAYHVCKKGLFYIDDDNLEKLPPKLYLEFLSADTDKKLSNFITKYKFCDFPVADDEVPKTKDPYLKYHSPHKGNYGSNWLYIYRKQFALKNIYSNFKNNELTFADRNFLRKEIAQNHFPYDFDKNSPAFSEIDDYEAEIKLSLDEYLDFTPWDKIENSSGYVIFGHYALCCLELLRDIDEKQRFCQNPNCRKPLPHNSNIRQKRCLKKDNPECFAQWKTIAKKMERENLRRRGRLKNKPRIKKRFL